MAGAQAATGEARSCALPELASVHWRPLADERNLRRSCLRWRLTTLWHTVPFVAVAGTLVGLSVLATPLAVICLAHAYLIPALYAQRGANVVRPKRFIYKVTDEGAERTALGLLGDLVGHEARDLLVETGLVLERGRFGVWLVGDAGALLVLPGGRTVMCWCVRASEPTLPRGDRIAHLLLALRADEAGFATVANLAFAGARRRVRGRLPKTMRPALERAGAVASAPAPALPPV
ncbi:MAG TPA: hypothetical protein VHX88_06050 [Solirubrobacteraceae bacterium]|jgi:hypothetical protein|nr:hypothetical protein [Solirubrobacteraceae bacterium]